MIIEEAEKEAEQYIGTQLNAYNSQFVPEAKSFPLEDINYVIRDDSQKIIAGLIAHLYCNATLYIKYLWIEESYRKKDYGSKLLKKAEERVSKNGGHLIYLDTYDFQAQKFYEKNGYKVFGVLQDAPTPGHTSTFMFKKLK